MMEEEDDKVAQFLSTVLDTIEKAQDEPDADQQKEDIEKIVERLDEVFDN